MIKFKVPQAVRPAKPKIDSVKMAKTIKLLRDYGRERGLPSKEVVATHKEYFRVAKG